MQIPYTLTDRSLTVLGSDFTPKTLPNNHPAFEEAVAALKRGDRETLYRLLDVQSAIVEFTQGEIAIVNRTLTFRGRVIDSALTRRILQFMDAGEDNLAQPLVNFLEKVMNNPSHRAVSGLFEWVERSNLPITPEGDILAWKIVKSDYRDVHSGLFDNSVGQVVEVARNEVDENPDVTCSYGLHFCSTAYLPHYGAFNEDRRVMVVRLDPADVVAFPRDYDTSKGRACRYTVIGEIPAGKAKEYFPSLVAEPDFEERHYGDLEDELEVGRYYRTRSGDIAHIDDFDDGEDIYPFAGLVLGAAKRHIWAEDGLWSITDDEHPLDLVELLPEDFDPADETEEPPAEKPKGFLSWIFGG